jgi:hypothetical protein
MPSKEKVITKLTQAIKNNPEISKQIMSIIETLSVEPNISETALFVYEHISEKDLELGPPISMPRSRN